MSYTNEENALIVIALLREHGISRVVVSPGATNVSFVRSVQMDPFFKLYSAVDERSAAYMACGMASETGEVVVLSCTGATASRNYYPGLTEAYYRKLPVLAITSSQQTGRIGHLVPQVIDRTSLPKDIVRTSQNLALVKDEEDRWVVSVRANLAILETRRRGGGPAHINLETGYSRAFDRIELPKVRSVRRYERGDQLPELSVTRVSVFVGAHSWMSPRLVSAIDDFCKAHNGAVFCDHTSGYHGRFRLPFSLVAGQRHLDIAEFRSEVLIHIGEVSGDYYSPRIVGTEVWRVSPDGELRDTFRKVTKVFEMDEISFFEAYRVPSKVVQTGFFQAGLAKLREFQSQIPEIPFSNLWVASQLSPQIPAASTLHLGILNSLRSWNFFELPVGVRTASNVGGFGIDGALSTLLGAALCDPDRLQFCVLGDLAFFYDINALGNRHVGANLRILLINNGKGTEFRNFDHGAADFGDAADEYIAAAGHFGNKSPVLVKSYVEALGFQYLCASTKDEFVAQAPRFVASPPASGSILFEVFTDSELESSALEMMLNLAKPSTASVAKGLVKKILKKAGLGPSAGTRGGH